MDVGLGAEPVHRPIEERVRRGRALLRPLAVERPAEHRVRAAIIVGPQSGQPFVDQRRLARAALGDEREDVDLAIGPGVVEAPQLGVAADEAFVGGLGEAVDVDKGGLHGHGRRARRAFARDDLICDLGDLVGRIRHVLHAVVKGKAGEWVGVARPKVLVLDLVQPSLWRRRQQQRIEMDIFALRLPVANGRDLSVDDVVGRHREAGDEQNENVAGAQFLFDLRVPIGAASHLAVDPHFEDAVLYGRRKEALHEAEPLDFTLGGLVRLVGVRVADEDDRLGRGGRHAGIHSTSARGVARAGKRVKAAGAAAEGSVPGDVTVPAVDLLESVFFRP